MDILNGKLVRLRTKLSDKIRESIPKSKIVSTQDGIDEVVVYWGVDEVKQLRKIGFKKVPPAPLHKYNWTGIYTPMSHQKTTSEFLVSHDRCFVLSEMGTGKTCSAAWAADYLLDQKLITRVLIVCPVSIMHAAWKEDLFRSVMHRKVAIAHGTKPQRDKVIKSEADFVIINFDGLEVVLDEIIAGGFDLIIVDEANNLKNVATRRWKAFNKIMTITNARLWMMTGTPAAQSPEDAYGLAKLVCPDRVPKYFGQWRDMVMQKISMYKWVSRPRSRDIVFNALQPAIRFTKEQCLDLPDITYARRDVELTKQQLHYYKTMKTQMLMSAAGEEVSAVNAAANINKLLQISCITGDTKVLSNSGWKRLDSVNLTDLIWDGEEWVTHSGLVYQGIKEVVTLDGVRMTSDHKVLTASGWYSAGEINNGGQSKKFNRTKVWIPDSYGPSWDDTGDSNAMCAMGMSVPMWEDCNSSKPVFESKTQSSSSQLRMPSWKRNAQNVVHTSVQNMDRYATQMLRPAGQRLQKLWWSGDNYMRPVGKFLRAVLAGYALSLWQAFNFGPNRCKQQLHTTKLSLGYCTGTSVQYEVQPTNRNPTRHNDNDQCLTSIQCKEKYSICSNSPVWMGCGEGADNSGEAVYDIINCGPRNRFVVQNGNGDPFIVHNCGAAYTDSGEVVRFDASNRLEVMDEIIDGSEKKTIIFAPFRHTIEMIKDHLSGRGVSTAFIHGDVSPAARGQIIKDFQDSPDVRVIVIQPQAASHGITLTAASSVIWFGPTSSVDTYLQANARAHRKGQDTKVSVYMIQGSPVEQRMYDMLEKRIDSHYDLINLYKEILQI
jgi:superfamily II DNA or RNA helicase